MTKRPKKSKPSTPEPKGKMQPVVIKSPLRRYGVKR